MKNQIFSSLFWKLALIFLSSLLIVSLVFIFISVKSSGKHYQEVSQRISRPVAERISKHNHLFLNGQLNEVELKKVFHDVMVVNPAIEVYLLDTLGNILAYDAPLGRVKVEQIDLEPVKSFIHDKENTFFTATNPRKPEVQHAFSAAEIKEDGKLIGYTYVVLASEIYNSAIDQLLGSYYLKNAGWSVLVALLGALVLGLILIWLLTRNLNVIINGVKSFKQGDLSARIQLKSRGELTILAEQFNLMAETINQNIEELKQLDRLKRELTASVSHDLRTPLASIQGYAETLSLKIKELDDTQKLEYASIIFRSAENMKRLVDDLFELSKLESGQLEPKLEPISLKELIYDISAKYKLMAEDKGIQINYNLPDKLPLIYADIGMIERVLQNLIDNAMRHTYRNGTIELGIEQRKKTVDVWVADSGVGIKENELPYIFDRYRTTSNSAEGGTGLGLAIVKKIIDLHKSSITVESKIEQGTRFSFGLPV